MILLMAQTDGCSELGVLCCSTVICVSHLKLPVRGKRPLEPKLRCMQEGVTRIVVTGWEQRILHANDLRLCIEMLLKLSLQAHLLTSAAYGSAIFQHEGPCRDAV